MGVDIQLVIEYADIPDSNTLIEDLTFIEFAEVHLGRNSNFFGHLAGVRGSSCPVVEPRGLPLNISDLVKSACLIKVVPQELPTTIEGIKDYKIVEINSCLELESASLLKGPDGTLNFTPFDRDSHLYYNTEYHTHSWLVLNELKEVYAKVLKESIYDNMNPAHGKAYGADAILKIMETLEKESQVLTRVVFWFNG